MEFLKGIARSLVGLIVLNIVLVPIMVLGPKEIHRRDQEAGLDRLHGMAADTASQIAKRRHAS
jgi:hypothetical protein